MPAVHKSFSGGKLIGSYSTDNSGNVVSSFGVNSQGTVQPTVGSADPYVDKGDPALTPGSTPYSAINLDPSRSIMPTSSFSLTSGNLKVGSVGTDVSNLQKLLGGGLVSDGKYGPLTEAAVKAFQTANGLNPDGIVGPNTTAMLNAKYGTGSSSSLNAPATGGVGNGVPSGVNGTYTPPNTTAGTNNDVYYTSLSQQVTNLQSTLDAEYKKQLDTIQKDKQHAEDELNNIRSKELNAINKEGTLASQEKEDKLAQLKIEQQRFDENYKTVQGLASQLMDLMTQGNALISSQKGVTGLGLIRNPRVNETINNITAAAGVIQAGIAVYNGQMNQAQNQLQTATTTITSAYGDQIDYYKSLANFYESKASDQSKKVTTLTANEQDFLKTKILMLEADKKRVQETSDMIQKAMVDPDTALAYASAGVTLNDSPAVINQKLAKYGYSKELADQSNDFAIKGYTALISGNPPAGSEVVRVTDTKGVVKTYYKKPTSSTTGTSGGKNYTATNIPDNVAADLNETLKNNPNRTLTDFFAAFPEVSSSYLTSLYNSYHPKNTITNPFLSAGAGLTDGASVIK